MVVSKSDSCLINKDLNLSYSPDWSRFEKKNILMNDHYNESLLKIIKVEEAMYSMKTILN